jgi:hypothetical protein
LWGEEGRDGNTCFLYIAAFLASLKIRLQTVLLIGRLPSFMLALNKYLNFLTQV